MGYETAPATKMLATHCCCCGRPLVDAVSVDWGIGPDCRKKHGYNIEVAPEARARANQIVHAIACNPEGTQVLDRCAELRVLGFEKLASVIEKRTVTVRLVQEGTVFLVHTAYDAQFVDDMRKISNARWNKENKAWQVPTFAREALWKALCKAYPGALALGPKGPFIVGAK